MRGMPAGAAASRVTLSNQVEEDAAKLSVQRSSCVKKERRKGEKLRVMSVIDGALTRSWVQPAAGSGWVCQTWLRRYRVREGKEKTVYENRARRRNNRKHCRGRTDSGLGKMLKWRCDQCFRTLRLLHSLSQTPPFVLALFSAPPLVILSKHQPSYNTIFDPLTFWLFVDPPLLCCSHVQMPNAQYIVDERKEVSILQIPRWKRRSFFLRDQTDKTVVRTPLACCWRRFRSQIMIWDFRPGAWLPLKFIPLNELLKLCINPMEAVLNFK